MKNMENLYEKSEILMRISYENTEYMESKCHVLKYTEVKYGKIKRT